MRLQHIANIRICIHISKQYLFFPRNQCLPPQNISPPPTYETFVWIQFSLWRSLARRQRRRFPSIRLRLIRNSSLHNTLLYWRNVQSLCVLLHCSPVRFVPSMSFNFTAGRRFLTCCLCCLLWNVWFDILLRPTTVPWKIEFISLAVRKRFLRADVRMNVSWRWVVTHSLPLLG